MFKLFRAASNAKDQAEESIQRSEGVAAKYHASISENAAAHDELLRKLDRRMAPRVA